MTIMPPEPMMEPTLRQRIVIDRHVQELLGDAAAGGSAGLHGLELFAVGDAAADVEDDLAKGDAHGDFDQAGVVDFSGQGKDLGALALFGADRRHTSRRRCG